MLRLKNLLGVGILYWTILSFSLTTGAFGQAVPQDAGRNGDKDGVKIWQLPDPPSGVGKPDQCWHAVGTDPYGAIYISGHDHSTNSMLYRLDPEDDILRWVGDARQASMDVDNWENGETAQKFHTRPVYHDGNVYVATTDRTDIGTGYKDTRGFHWYAYDIASGKFVDASADQPNGVGADQYQVISIASDPIRNILYGTANASMTLVNYNLTENTVAVLGKPSQWSKESIYVNRFFWVDSRGRVYITAGNERGQWYSGEQKDIFENVFYYDPSQNEFGEMDDWELDAAICMEAGQWNKEHTRLYMCSDQGHFYRFDDDGPSWTSLGRPDGLPGNKSWSMNLSFDEKKIYIGLSDGMPQTLYEWDLASGDLHELARMSELDGQAGGTAFITGYDSWDRKGNFYHANFSMYDGRNVYLSRINPVRIKVEKGMLDKLIEVSAVSSAGGVIISHGGNTQEELEVIYDVMGLGADGNLLEKTFGEVAIPAGKTSVTLPFSQVVQPEAAGIQSTMFSVIGDGNDYITAGDNEPFSLAIQPRQGRSAFKNLLRTHTNKGGALVFNLNLPIGLHTRLSIQDMKGRLVQVLVNKYLTAGDHEILWAPTTRPGVYTARVDAGSNSMLQKFMVLSR